MILPAQHQIRLLAADETPPMALLLEGDSSERMIAHYLSQSQVFVYEESGATIGVCVLQNTSDDTCEVMNIAVAAERRNQGIGKKLLLHAIDLARRSGCRSIEIATGNSGIGQLYLYQRAGFEMVSLELDYFVKNYDEPIVEDGIACRHRIRLRLNFV